jgi:hypothetical protein
LAIFNPLLVNIFFTKKGEFVTDYLFLLQNSFGKMAREFARKKKEKKKRLDSCGLLSFFLLI